MLGRLHFLDGSEGKESACNAGDPGLIPELEISPGEGNGYPPQSSILARKPHGVRKATLSLGFSRQEHWSGLPFTSPGDLPDPGIEPKSLALQADSLPSELQGSPVKG